MFPNNILQRMRLANIGLLLLRKPGPFPFWICFCSNVETINFLALIFERSLGTSILLKIQKNERSSAYVLMSMIYYYWF